MSMSAPNPSARTARSAAWQWFTQPTRRRDAPRGAVAHGGAASTAVHPGATWSLGASVSALTYLIGLHRPKGMPPAAPRAASNLSGTSVRTLLGLLTIATAAPLIALLAYQLRATQQAEVAQANQFVTHLAEITATDVELTLRNFERVATILAQRPLVRELDPARCDPRLRELRRTYPMLSNVGTVTIDGQVICSTLESTEARRPHIGQPDWLKRLRTTGAFVVGSPQRGIYTGRHILVVAVPIFDAAERISGAAQLVIDLEKFLPLVTKGLPEGGVAGILNRDGIVVTRSFRPAEVIGKDVRGIGINNAILERKHGSEVSVGADGVERFYAFRPIGDYGWFSSVGIPTERIYAEARANAVRNGVLGVAAVLLAFILVRLIHHKIALPMLALRRSARRVASGERSERAPIAGPREVADVATGFNQMLDALLLTENRLQDTEAQYHLLFDSSPDAMRVICDERIVLMNPAGFRLLGMPPDALRSDKSVFDYIHPDFVERARARLRSVIEERRTLPAEERKSIRADGTEIDVEVITLPITFQGKPAALDIVHDLTERNATRRALEQLNTELEKRVHARTAELERANAELEAFSYTIAHDLRVPLRAINGYTRLVLDARDSRLDDEHRALLGRVLGSAETMNNLLEGLLKLSHLARSEPVLTQVDLSALAREVFDTLYASTPDRLVDVQIDDGLAAYADAQLIRTVLENLLGNAWKYTGRTETPRIAFGSTRLAGIQTYFVRDNGAGFDQRYADKLFKTFQRLHGPEDFSGSGIGLASVKRIIEHHHGMVWAEAEVGKGATFYFTLGTRESDQPQS